MNVLIHAAGAANFGYALYYDLTFVHAPAHLRNKGNFASMSAFPGKWKYLTIWNMVLQLVYHTIALVNDLTGTSELNIKRQSKLQKVRDHIFACWAFPAGVFVSLSFWILYGIDRSLVFPKEMDLFFPNWLNHSVHTAPVGILMVEIAFAAKIYPSRSTGVLANVFFSAVYMTCITFWAIYSFDRELMFPAILDTFFPLWLNHAVHTGPLLFVLLEHGFVPLIYPKPIIGALNVIGGISVYLSWIIWVNQVSNVWAYPVLTIMNNYQRAGFMAGCAIAILICYFVGDLMNQWLWGRAYEGKPVVHIVTGKAGKSAKGKRKTK